MKKLGKFPFMVPPVINWGEILVKHDIKIKYGGGTKWHMGYERVHSAFDFAAV